MNMAGKLQLKPGQSIALVGIPTDLTMDVAPAVVGNSPDSADAVLSFVVKAADVEEKARSSVSAARRGAIAWVAYPKAGQLGTDLRRDSLVALMIERGLGPVRQVAIDEVWSALRFRPRR